MSYFLRNHIIKNTPIPVLESFAYHCCNLNNYKIVSKQQIKSWFAKYNPKVKILYILY